VASRNARSIKQKARHRRALSNRCCDLSYRTVIGAGSGGTAVGGVGGCGAADICCCGAAAPTTCPGIG
jgi:hypothetical protein